MLDKKYAETMKVIDDKLAKQPIGVQIGTDGWKRKNVNEAQKILHRQLSRWQHTIPYST